MNGTVKLDNLRSCYLCGQSVFWSDSVASSGRAYTEELTHRSSVVYCILPHSLGQPLVAFWCIRTGKSAIVAWLALSHFHTGALEVL